MCVPGEEGPTGIDGSVVGAGAGGGGSAGGGYGGGAIPEIVVTAPRLGLDMEIVDLVDWSEAAKQGAYGAAIGAMSGNLAVAIGSGILTTAAAAEAQPGVDLEDMFEVKNDMIYVRGGFAPYHPIY